MSPIALVFILLIIGALVGFFIPGEGRKMFKGWYGIGFGDDEDEEDGDGDGDEDGDGDGDGDGDDSLTCDGANQQLNTAGDACECVEGYSFDDDDVCQEILSGVIVELRGVGSAGKGPLFRILETEYQSNKAFIDNATQVELKDGTITHIMTIASVGDKDGVRRVINMTQHVQATDGYTIPFDWQSMQTPDPKNTARFF